jgi:hypothetical protein
VLWLEEDLVGALRSLTSTQARGTVLGPVRLRPGEALVPALAELAFPGLAE